MINAIFKYNNHDYEISPVLPGEHIIEIIKNTGTFYEINMLEKIRDLNLSGVYVDIGANMGNHSLYFLNECNSTKVISIEPEITIYHTLLYNIQKNKRVDSISETFNCALSNKIGFVHMDLDFKNTGSTKAIESLSGETKCFLLDSIIKEEDISLIKIDAEGYELKILEGSVNILSSCNPVVICEAQNMATLSILKKFLSQFGFKTDGFSLSSTPSYMWKKC